MKRFPALFVLLSVGISVTAQDSSDYRRLLDTTRELVYTDSLRFSQLGADTTQLDSATVKKYLSPLLSSGNNKFKNKTYSLLGRIGGNNNYDLLVVLEEKKRSDSSGINVTYLVSMKRSGEYISSIKAAVSGTKKKSGYNISSSLYKGNRIMMDSKIVTNNKLFEDVTYYRISPGGRFILSEKDN